MRHAIVALALFVLGCATREAPPTSAPSGAGKDGFVRETLPITAGVWLIHRPKPTYAPFEGNVTVVEQAAGLVVIDAGGAPPAGEHVVREIRKISAKPVHTLVYTHYHGDHNLGAGALLRAWPDLQIVSTTRTRENMTGAPMHYIRTYSRDYQGVVDLARERLASSDLSPAERRGWQNQVDAGQSMVDGYRDLRAYPATRTFDDRLTLPDERAPIELIHPGRANTDGDAVAWLPRQRVLVTGDIVVAPVPYAAHSFPGEWIAALEQLRAIEFVHLIPGHGLPQTDRAHLDRLIAALTEVRAAVAPLATAGLSLADVRRRTDFSGFKRTFAGDDTWDQFLVEQFFIGPIVKNAYQEARGEAIVQGAN
jgi:glyoxylase-like metal-dependent hydrolase (beta-lactamase superfamily II)